jgi:uncharacterized protein YabN with tetrapyrrole methylase and pyrophosphatase domain
LDAERALREANRKFKRRFESMERLARAKKIRLSDLSPSELDRLWESSKRALRANKKAALNK